MRTLMLAFLLGACGSTSSDVRTPDGSDDPIDDPVVDDDPVYDGPFGFIGAPCETDADCPYDGGACLTAADGYPGGMCSAACDRYCEDADGHPTTFCVDGPQVPGPGLDADGACFSRCDFGLFPDTGCRDDYGCVVQDRANDTKQTYVCMPNARTELSDCPAELAARGVPFELAVIPPSHPANHPDLTCTVDDPVYVLGEVHGVELRYADGSPTPRVLGACSMALALTDTIDDVAVDGVTALYHYGTYNCRVISGTDKLSRHAFGDAIDIVGFEFDDGARWTLKDHWEHDTTSPRSESARWLYDSAYRWYDEEIWNIILTPNYNAAHDDHFHVDLTPGSDYIGFTDGRYIGPAPYSD